MRILIASLSVAILNLSTISSGVALTPEETPAASSSLTILEANDAALYREIFALQKKGAWSAADKKLAKLNNKILMGYVLHQRYLHPTAYKSSYKELRSWMAYYADHPNADEIYSLAKKRRPKGANSPKRYQTRKWRTLENFQMAPALKADYAKTNRNRVAKIEGRVRYLSRKESATKALKEISIHRKNRVITERQYDRMRSWIAASLYYQGYIDTAKKLSNEVAKRNGENAVLSHWIAGLIAFRENDIEKSYEHFNAMAAVTYQEDALRSAAAFWAARSALGADKPKSIIPNLEIAAKFPFTFYGQLALSQLGTEYDYDWSTPFIDNSGALALAQTHPGIGRAMALVQAGRTTQADLELRWVNGAIDDSQEYQLMAIAAGLDLPSAQIDIANAGTSSYLNAGRYPIPNFTPRDGFKTDRAILYALMRQESKFKMDATSRVGARGLMQLMPRTASYVARDRSLQQRKGRNKLYDPSLNLQIGQTYVNELIAKHTDGDLFKMAVAYNGGPGNLRRWAKDMSINDSLLFIESIPNPESRDFVEKVLTNVWVYRARLGQPAPSRDKVAAGQLPLYEAIDQLNDY